MNHRDNEPDINGEQDNYLSDYSKYCCACGRGIEPMEKRRYATSTHRNSNGKIRKTMRLICESCKNDGVEF